MALATARARASRLAFLLFIFITFFGDFLKFMCSQMDNERLWSIMRNATMFVDCVPVRVNFSLGFLICDWRCDGSHHPEALLCL